MEEKNRTKILITGSTGFLGNYLSEFLSAKDYDIKKASRKKFNDKQADLDLGKAINWREYLYGIDCIVHTAAKVHDFSHKPNDISNNEYDNINCKATVNLAKQAAEIGVKKFIFISTVKVCGEFSKKDNPFEENTETKVTEPYALSKKNAEKKLMSIAKKTKMKIVIIRSPLVYGPGVGANFRKMLEWVNRDVPLPLGKIENLRSMIYIENLADFIWNCITSENISNDIFLISDDQDISTSNLLIKIANVMNKKNKLFYLPNKLMYLILLLTGNKRIYEKLYLSLNINISKAKKTLGWKPKIKLDMGIKKTINFYFKNEI